MTNSVQDAKQAAYKNFCELSDLEVCYRDVDLIFKVDEDGTMADFVEEYWADGRIAYYNCTNCYRSWAVQDYKDESQTFSAVKEHLSEKGII